MRTAKMEKTLRILLIEDSEDDALLLVRHLKKGGIHPITQRVQTVDSLRSALRSVPWEAILCDVVMPDLNAFEALKEYRSAGIDIPFIVVSGTLPEEQLVELMRAGAHDIIVKDRPSRLVAAIVREMDEAAGRHKRILAENRLRASEERFRSAFETAPYGMALLTPDGQMFQVNKALCDIVRYRAEELLSRSLQAITHPDDLETNLAFVGQVLTGEIPSYQMEKRYIRKDGTIVWVLQSAVLVRDNSGAPLYFISQTVDLSALKRAEEEQAWLEKQLRHSQKMESLGTLSGGIAHEFNNMLLPISGLIELSLDAVEDKPDIHENLEKALENAHRAAALVEKILTFSRIDNCALVRTNMASAIEEAVSLLRATVPSTISISKYLSDVGDVYIDKAQISQIVMNLGINAMHAIGSGIGRIEFRLDAETIVRSRMTTCGELLPGRYARLTITDTGSGMDEETMTRIFEPFFTTKEVGVGTGMGLAFVHGLITQHGGMIDVRSGPGEGSAFDLFVPFESAAVAAARDSAAA